MSTVIIQFTVCMFTNHSSVSLCTPSQCYSFSPWCCFNTMTLKSWIVVCSILKHLCYVWGLHVILIALSISLEDKWNAAWSCIYWCRGSQCDNCIHPYNKT